MHTTQIPRHTSHMHPTIFSRTQRLNSQARNLAGLGRLTSTAFFFPFSKRTARGQHEDSTVVSIRTVRICLSLLFLSLFLSFFLSFCTSQPALSSPCMSYDYVSPSVLGLNHHACAPANSYNLTHEIIPPKKRRHKRSRTHMETDVKIIHTKKRHMNPTLRL
jgi:hypothetical protein